MEWERSVDERELREGDAVSAQSGDASPTSTGTKVERFAAVARSVSESGAVVKTKVSRTQWDEVSFIISSQYRVDVIERLSDSPATPSRIANDSDNALPHVSRALQELRDRSFVELLVSEDRKKGRVYGITDKAERLWNTIQTENLA